MPQHGVVDMPQPNPPPLVQPRLDPGVGPVRPASGGEVKTDGKVVTNSPGPYSTEYPRPPRDR
jgi:hypothetical protein